MSLFEDLSVRYIKDLIADFQLQDYQAAGIVGNGGHESGGFTQLQELHPTSGRGGLGHFQWTGPRRVAFEEWIARHPGGTAASYEINYGQLYRELREGGPEHASLVATLQTHTIEEATRVFCEKFERPGVVAVESRLKWAQRALDAFHAAGSPIVVHAGGDSSGASAKPTDRITDFIRHLIEHPEQAQQLVRIVVGFYNSLHPDKPIPIDQKPVAAPASSKDVPPSFPISLTALGTSLGAMITGHLGTPFGLGENPTSAGSLAVLISGFSAVISYFGGWGKMASFALNIIGGLASMLPNRKPQ